MLVKKLERNDLVDFKQLLGIYKEVFENDQPLASDERLLRLLASPDFIVFVVKLEENVVGGLTVYVLHRYFGDKPVAYIYDVGIATAFQGKGFGKALMAEVCDFCKTQGFEDAYVEAESEDVDAVEFYRKTRFSSELLAVHFTYDFN